MSSTTKTVVEATQGLKICLIWIKNAKRDLEQARTRAEGLEVFEIDAWRSRKSFECENGHLNEEKGRSLVAVGQNLELAI